MTLWREINEIHGSEREWRKFGLTLGLVFGLLAGLLIWRGKAHAIIFGGVSVFFLFFGILVPGLLKPIHKVWMGLALMMGWVMSRVLLAALFFLAITPVALILRLSGKDILNLRPREKKDSYWTAHKTRAKDDYENQF